MTPDPIGLDGGINLFVYALNNPVNFVDPYGLLTKSYLEATGGGWKAPPKPPYGGGENQFGKMRQEHQQALVWGTGAGVAAGAATGNPASGVVFGTIITVGECVTCHWMQEVADMYNENHPPKKEDYPCPQ